MPARWTLEEEKQKYRKLHQLYVVERKTIFEIGKILQIPYNTVFNRLKRLNIPTDPLRKANYWKRNKVRLPTAFNKNLAEFVGVVLGDGHLSFRTGQFYITVNKITDYDYIEYVSNLIYNLFKIKPSITNSTRINELNISNVFVTSVDLMKYLPKIGLISTNKVQDQIGVPTWILKSKKFMKHFLRGFFDTDGSVYKLRFGVQMSFRNSSVPLLQGIRRILLYLHYHPSKISANAVYLTRRSDLKRYFSEISCGNTKHLKRAKKFGIIV